MEHKLFRKIIIQKPHRKAERFVSKRNCECCTHSFAATIFSNRKIPNNFLAENFARFFLMTTTFMSLRFIIHFQSNNLSVFFAFHISFFISLSHSPVVCVCRCVCVCSLSSIFHFVRNGPKTLKSFRFGCALNGPSRRDCDGKSECSMETLESTLGLKIN